MKGRVAGLDPVGRAARKRGCQLGPGADLEFAVGAGQVVLHGSLGDEQGRRDLPVRLPDRRQLRHPQFARRQRVAATGGIKAFGGTFRLVVNP